MTAISVADLRALAPAGAPAILNALAPQLGPMLDRYGINTPLRVAHFLAQAAHETAGFTTLVELGSEAYFNKRYGPGTGAGKRLGNTQVGDGARFRGRGIFQCTGRDNYRYFGQRIGIDLIENPGLADEPLYSLKIACEYWTVRGINPLADRDDVEGVTRKINGGQNGLADRKRYLAKAKTIFTGAKLAAPLPRPKPILPGIAEPAPAVPPERIITAPLPDAPIATEAPPPLAESKTVLSAVTAVAGSGALSVLSYIQSPWAFGAFAIVALVAGFIIWDRRRKRQVFGI